MQQHRPRIGALGHALADACEARSNLGFGLAFVLVGELGERRLLLIGIRSTVAPRFRRPVAPRFRRLVALGIDHAELELERCGSGTACQQAADRRLRDPHLAGDLGTRAALVTECAGALLAACVKTVRTAPLGDKCGRTLRLGTGDKPADVLGTETEHLCHLKA